MSKAVAIQHFKPRTIILGSSRTEYGINPDHSSFENIGPSYNLALSSANLYEAYRYMQHANEIQPLDQVILMLDFFMFNAVGNPEESEFNEKLLSTDLLGNPQFTLIQKVSPFISLDTFFSSLATIIRQKSREKTYLFNGVRIRKNEKNKKQYGIHTSFLRTENIFYTRNYSKFSFATLQRDNWKIYKQLLLFAQQKGIKLHIAISPSHVRLFEVIAAKGLWNKFEQWKRLIVQFNKEIAIYANNNPFKVFDFSGYNSLTTETVPPLGDMHTEMQWFWDASHYKKELGDLVLDRIFNFNSPKRFLPNDFGIILTPENIEKNIEKNKINRIIWRKLHPDDVKEIEKLRI